MVTKEYLVRRNDRTSFYWTAALFGTPLLLLVLFSDESASVLFWLGLLVALILVPSGVTAFSRRVRVSELGVSQSVLGWGVFWPWEAFQSGAVALSEVEKFCFIRTDLPWWSRGRKLWLMTLDGDDWEEVMTEIISRLPPSPLRDAAEHQMKPFRSTPKTWYDYGQLTWRMLCGVVGLAIQLAITAFVFMATVLLEACLDTRLIRGMDERSGQLFVLAIFVSVMYLTTETVLRLFVRIGLIKE